MIETSRLERRVLSALLVVSALLALSVSTACDDNKKKECAEKCAKEAQACVERKESGCEERAKKCAEHCE
jgi:hypothetical protein